MPGPTTDQRNALVERDCEITALRGEIKKADNRQEELKDRMEILAKKLQDLEQQHGPLISLLEAVGNNVKPMTMSMTSPPVMSTPVPAPVGQPVMVRRLSTPSLVSSSSPMPRVPGGGVRQQVQASHISPPPLAKTVGWTMQSATNGRNGSN